MCASLVSLGETSIQMLNLISAMTLPLSTAMVYGDGIAAGSILTP
jgi:hypothetical protein